MTTYTQPYIRSQVDLLAWIRDRVRDPSGASSRWTDKEIYEAINDALAIWQDKVLIARLYSLTGGWLSTTWEYALPSYMRRPLIAQMRTDVPWTGDLESVLSQTWVDFPIRTEPDSTGGLVMRPLRSPRTVPGRVIWYATNGPVPVGATLPTLNTGINTVETSIIVNGELEEAADVGWIKIGTEIIGYAGITRAAATTTLLNGARGEYDTTPATHSSSDTVEWCIAVDDIGLWQQLRYQVTANLHSLFLSDGSVHETSRHERAMLFFQERADKFWGSYAGQGPGPQIYLTRFGRPWTAW